jgi:hypothetical protein
LQGNLILFHKTIKCWDVFLLTNLEYIFESDFFKCFNIYNRKRNMISNLCRPELVVYVSYTQSNFQRWRRFLNLTYIVLHCVIHDHRYDSVDDFGNYLSHVYVSRASSSMVVKLHTTNILQVFTIHTLSMQGNSEIRHNFK